MFVIKNTPALMNTVAYPDLNLFFIKILLNEIIAADYIRWIICFNEKIQLRQTQKSLANNVENDQIDDDEPFRKG